ncbi:alpha-galactosidase [Streptomyces sp. VRA16 Mangrove soil]|uniref:glycoside hydrolase family 36 protein n=1 Tax=Streptomyces sp. VRA16 Mangrove soil TaxID=2817434 RepID=UPI0027DC7613|nr:alpha-galactosidase [Streptomyces sp. VRA16 Mangrove soil]
MTSTAVTTAERPPAPTHRLLDQVRVAVLVDGTPLQPAVRSLPDGTHALDVSAPEGAAVEIRLSTPLRDAVGYWYPDCGWQRALPPDWAGALDTCLVRGAAIGCLYETSGATLLTFAAQDHSAEVRTVFGVSEQHKQFVVHLELTARDEPYTVILAPRSASPAAALRVVRRRLLASSPLAPLPLPGAGRTPAYSTWYSFGQDVTAAGVEREARLAADLGCGLVILDDGWQRGGRERGYAWAGDWQVDTEKFPDLAGHVHTVHELGLAYIAWLGPLLLGPASPAWERLSPYALVPSPTAPGAYVLDPRHCEVRAHVVDTCTRLVADHGLDGLKLDFLDDATVYADAGGSVAEAMAVLLGDIREALTALCPQGPLIELRQPYLGPGMSAYGNLLRATDCPADATANRVRTVDAALTAIGGAVHSDMLMWDPDAEPEWAVRQLLAVLHAVPQLSCRIGDLTASQHEALAFWLRQWKRLAPTLLDGDVEPGRPDELYPVLQAHAGEHQVAVVHADRPVPLDLLSHPRADLVNATGADTLVCNVPHGPVEAAITAYDARGRVTGSWVRTLGGPMALTVPRSGLLSILAAHH